MKIILGIETIIYTADNSSNSKELRSVMICLLQPQPSTSQNMILDNV